MCERESLTKIPWSNYRFKGEKDSHVVNSDIPRSRANEIKYFWEFREWGERTRCRGDEGEDEEVQVKGENRNR